MLLPVHRNPAAFMTSSIGMFLASFVVGYLADRGANQTFWKSLGAAYLGSICIFSLGLIGLHPFIGANALLSAGLFPFLPGDLIKNTLAAFIAYSATKKVTLGRN